MMHEDFARATDCFKKALKLEPKNMEYLDAYGAFLADIGRSEEAVKVLKRRLCLLCLVFAGSDCACFYSVRCCLCRVIAADCAAIAARCFASRCHRQETNQRAAMVQK